MICIREEKKTNCHKFRSECSKLCRVANLSGNELPPLNPDLIFLNPKINIEIFGSNICRRHRYWVLRAVLFGTIQFVLVAWWRETHLHFLSSRWGIIAYEGGDIQDGASSKWDIHQPKFESVFLISFEEKFHGF